MLRRFGSAILLLSLLAAARAEAAEQDKRDRPHTEFGVLPAFGVNSDTGVAVGAYVQAVRFEKGARPYAWALRTQLSASFLDTPRGLELPYHDDFIRLDLPRLPTSQSRLLVELLFNRQTNAGYWGLGNKPPSDPPGAGDRDHQYLVQNLALRGFVQQKLGSPHWKLHAGPGIARVWPSLYSPSRLEADVAAHEASGAPLSGTSPYTQVTAIAGLVLDTRNHETWPRSGLFHDAVLRIAPDGLNAMPHAGFTLTTRFYAPVSRDRVVFACRAVADVLAGDVPVQELARYGGVVAKPGPGGMFGIRGVPQGRLHGKTKAFVNLELRSLFLPFRIGTEQFTLGAAAFLDAGRVWAGALQPEASLDGAGLGLHWGAGGGPRLRWGDSLLIRIDLAHSPDAARSGRDSSVSLYMTADQAF